MKLKTLKEIPIEWEDIELIDKIKAEAIKRYKSNLERMQNTTDDREMLILEGKNQEIEEFYDLTEEDLK